MKIFYCVCVDNGIEKFQHGHNISRPLCYVNIKLEKFLKRCVLMKKNIFDRVQALCQNNGIAISELEKRLNLSNGAIGKWRKSSPTAEKVAAVASYFDVSTDYLLGLTDVEKNVFKDNMLLSLEKAMSRMTDEDKDRMMRILKAGFDEAFQDKDDASEE